jgi:hypothetical protein
MLLRLYFLFLVIITMIPTKSRFDFMKVHAFDNEKSPTWMGD